MRWISEETTKFSYVTAGFLKTNHSQNSENNSNVFELCHQKKCVKVQVQIGCHHHHCLI